MQVVDVNTSFGKRVDSDERFSLDALLQELDNHSVACALSYSQRGAEYNSHEGNTESLAASRQYPQIVPVGTVDLRECLGWEAELARCLNEGVKALRLFPGMQGWSVASASFQNLLKCLDGSGVCLMFSLADAGGGWSSAAQMAEVTAPSGLPVILCDTYYQDMAEVIAVARGHEHVYVETNWLASMDAVEIMVEQVGAGRLVYGSAAPARPMQKALNQVLEAEISDEEKAAVLGGNALRLLGIKLQALAGRPELTDAQPKMFDEEIIDIHSHLGHWRCPARDEDYDPAGMLGRMKRYGVSTSVLSSYESMRYDVAAGNRRLAEAIEGHPELLGYVEVNPHQLELSCAEMDRYYALPNFVGAEVELTHIPSPTGGEKVRRLMAEIGRRGRPVLFKPAGADDARAERQLARDNPGLTIIHAHGFDADWARVVADTPNVCVEFNLSRPSHHDVRDSLDLLGPERVLFGSDQTLLSVGASVGLYLDAKMNAEETGPVLNGNAKRIFKL